jgi:6-phosphogluconolactonase/glucosamine-6-phosphate isomerase/deaminase
MEVGDGDPTAAARAYERELAVLAGGLAPGNGLVETGSDGSVGVGRRATVAMPVLDLVHLGLGEDGHTASLVPGDPVLDVRDRSVAATEEYKGHRRVTLTYPVLAAARRILWLATGEGKAEMVARLMAGDESVPAGSVPSARALLVVDEAAAHLLPR